MTVERDPRTDPRPGDVFEKNRETLRYIGRIGDHHAFQPESKRTLRYVAAHSFARWAKSATIIKRAD